MSWAKLGRMLDRTAVIKRAEKQGWSSDKILQEAAKRGIANDPNVLGIYKQKKQQEQQAYNTALRKQQYGITSGGQTETPDPSEQMYNLASGTTMPEQSKTSPTSSQDTESGSSQEVKLNQIPEYIRAPGQTSSEAQQTNSSSGRAMTGGESGTGASQVSTLGYEPGGKVSNGIQQDSDKFTGGGASPATQTTAQPSPQIPSVKSNVGGVELDPYKVTQQNIDSIVNSAPGIENQSQAIDMVTIAQKNANNQYAGLVQGAAPDDLEATLNKIPAQARGSTAVQDALGEKVNEEVAREIIRQGGGSDYAYKTGVIDRALDKVERQTGQKFDLTQENYKEIEHLVDLYKDPMEQVKMRANAYAKRTGIKKDTISELVDLMQTKLDMKKFKQGKVKDFLKLMRDYYEKGVAKKGGELIGTTQDEIPEMLDIANVIKKNLKGQLGGAIDNGDANILYGQIEGLTAELADMNDLGGGYRSGTQAGQLGTQDNKEYSRNSSNAEIANSLGQD